MSNQKDKNTLFLKGSKLIIEELFKNNQETDNEIYLSIIKHVKILKDKLKKNEEYPFYKPQKVNRQLKLFKHRGYLMREESGFISALNNRNYEALIYEIKCKLPNTWYNDKLYIGITGRTLKTRFREHVKEAIRECSRTNNTPGSGYTKLYQAIANSIINAGWNIGLLNEQLRILAGKKYHSLLYKVINSIKDIYIIPNVIEIHEYIDTAHKREKYYTKRFRTVQNGLNEYEGGGYKGKHLRVPLYDIALMTAFGKNLHQIARILSSLYNFEVSKETVARRILDFFGGWYEAQLKFLKPIIEKLFLEGYNGHEIYRVFEEISGQHQATWFNDWRWGEALLEFDLLKAKEELEKQNLSVGDDIKAIYKFIDKRFFGIPQSQWIKWAIEGDSRRQIEDKLGFSAKSITHIYEKIGDGQENIQIKYRRLKAIEILKNEGWNIEDIYAIAFNKAPNTPYKRIKSLAKEYFENKLFPGMTVEEIYQKYKN